MKPGTSTAPKLRYGVWRLFERKQPNVSMLMQRMGFKTDIEYPETTKVVLQPEY